MELATVLASSAALAAFALPAGASSAQFTLIEGFASSVDTVAYQQPVTFTGELAEGSAKTPVPDEPVQIEFQPPGQGGFVPVATGTTGSAGQFSVTTTLSSGGYVRAVFACDTDLAPSVSNPAFGSLLAATHVPSRLVLDPVSSSIPPGRRSFSDDAGGGQRDLAAVQVASPLHHRPYTSTQPNAMFPATTGSDAGSA
jgi:hypothetical protein